MNRALLETANRQAQLPNPVVLRSRPTPHPHLPRRDPQATHPPGRTPELFERLLPYAIALGLAHQWSAKFASVLAAATAPQWNVGSRAFDGDSFDHSLNDAVAETSGPSSLSGSSGGGFSGGGFSGGGGGGGGR